MLPGGDHALISVYSAPPNTDTAFIDILTLKDLSRKTVARGGTSARYLPSGHLIYSNRNTVFAMPFDLATREPRGAAVPVLTDVAYDSAAGIPQMDISRDGTLVYRRNVAGEARHVHADVVRCGRQPAGAARQSGALREHTTSVAGRQEARDHSQGWRGSGRVDL